MVATPPVACEFSAGDRVLYTNDYGAQFDRTVRGFCREVQSYGGFVYLDADAWWFPVKAESLRHLASIGADA